MVVIVFRPMAAAIGQPVMAQKPHVMIVKKMWSPWFAPRFWTWR
ncbi:hypothetical protein OG288_12355 [Streptomyces tauricus]|uniref:Uncharacterized protein n=1 Tax=Streptomyces tauricus TaxID=68274 RepID=A0ABZ1JFJ7_9ACTN|nr:hypothetical protein [Streptomyces tauricus]